MSNLPPPAQRALDHAVHLLDQRRVDEALAAVIQAHRQGAPPATSAWTRWMCHMLLGDFEAAWQVSDHIVATTPPPDFNRRDLPRHLRQVWNGTPLAGKHVLVRCHHGLGDVLQFIRFVPQVRAIARSVTAMIEPGLFCLLRHLPEIDALVDIDAPDPPFDVDIECMELAHALRCRPETLPRPPYLPPMAERRCGPHPRIGLVWAAGGWDGGHRSVPTAMLTKLCQRPGIDWICLQRGAGLAALQPEHGLRFAEPVEDDEDLGRTAVHLQSLNLIITVDTMIAHLAGALALPVWTLLPFAADWRWMLHRCDSPWYPTMRLFRQPTAGDWATPLDRIADELALRFR